MAHTNLISQISTARLSRDLEEIDRLLHRIKKHIDTLPPHTADANLSSVWKRTAGIISQERAEEIIASIAQSRKKWSDNSARIEQMWHSE
ncbi:hypothetical protein HYW17_02260 [Candidatus Uhrbacteria bacterium]|nr:hypothetical protein [Candidatus Uhrbacteria bacterium]